MDSVYSWPAYLAEAVFEGKKDTEIISLHDWFGSLFAKPFLVHHVKLYPKCILFGNRKSFFSVVKEYNEKCINQPQFGWLQ